MTVVTDPEAALYRSTLRWTGIALAILLVAGVVVGFLLDGGAGAVAASVGVGVAALGGMTTQAAMAVGHKKSVETMAAILAGSWLLKMAILIGALIILQNVEAFNRPIFGVCALAGVVITLVIDVWILKKSRIPYVGPRTQ